MIYGKIACRTLSGPFSIHNTEGAVVCFHPEVAVIGAGYIAVEMAGILHALGSETHLYFRALAKENMRSCCE